MGMRRTAVIGIVGLGLILLAGAVAFGAVRGGPPAEPGSQTIAAPIDQLEVVVRDSNPPQITLKVTAGLPSGCAKQDSFSTSRAGDTITVAVLNRMPTGNVACTAIYGGYVLNIDLGHDFRPGATYTVRVNDKTTSFKT